jgi:CRISPR/Cas system-associated exonuclease Cas4 (RecB family)
MEVTMDTIPAWSYSRLTIFEQCKYRAKLAFIDKIPEPERELPPGKTEHANDRGTRVHTGAELFVKGGTELIPELKAFAPEFLKLRELYAQGKVSLEGEWAINRDWLPVDWRSRDAWARIKLDAIVFMSKTHAVVIDYKTGKKFGNEIKHAEQTRLYQLAAFLRYPELTNIDVELWYTDQDEITHTSFTRTQGMKFLRDFDRRGKLITNATDFPPNPNMVSCKWCPYGPKNSGHCTRGV